LYNTLALPASLYISGNWTIKPRDTRRTGALGKNVKQTQRLQRN